MNRIKLLRLLRSAGYAGDGSDADVLAWVAQNRVEILDDKNEPVDIKGVLERKVTIAVGVAADAGEEVEVLPPAVERGAGQGGEGVEEDEEEIPPPRSAQFVPDVTAAPVATGRALVRRSAASAAGRAIRATAREASAAWRDPASFERAARNRRYNQRAALGQTAYSDAEEAEFVGAWLRLHTVGSLSYYPERRSDIEIVGRANIIASQSLGGALVPQSFQAALIDLRSDRGVARRLASVHTMATKSDVFPRGTSNVTVYAQDTDGATMTESNRTYDNVSLNAKTWYCISTYSIQLFNQAVVDIADDITKSMAWAIADKEDDIFINGDGSSTYFGFVGLGGKFRQVVEDAGGTWATNAGNAAGIAVASGNAWSEITHDDILALLSRVEVYPNFRPVLVCSQQFFHQVLARLSVKPGASGATAGASRTEIVAGVKYMFEGYDVLIAQRMPRAEANSQFCLFFGDFKLGSKIGDVQNSMSIATSDQRYFEAGKVAIRLMQDTGIVVHDVGDYNATATSRNPGPIAGLLTAAS